jgi:hypothetical protein
MCFGLPKEVVDTKTTSIANFTKLQIPLIRKIYPKMIAERLTGVQPMRDPTIPLEGYARIIKRLEDGLLLSLDISIPNSECVMLETLPYESEGIRRIAMLAFAGPKTKVTFEDGTEKTGKFQSFREDNGSYRIKWV